MFEKYGNKNSQEANTGKIALNKTKSTASACSRKGKLFGFCILL